MSLNLDEVTTDNGNNPSTKSFFQQLHHLERTGSHEETTLCNMKFIIRKRQLSSLIRILVAILAAFTCLQYWLTEIHSSDSHSRVSLQNAIVPGESSNLFSKDAITPRKYPDQLNTTVPASPCTTRIHAKEVASDIRPPTAIRKWAYAFLVSGCGEKSPGYKGFLYNIMVAAERLREMGSQADVVLLVQLAFDNPEKVLPSIEEELLCSTGVKIRYLPKARAKIHECFYNLMLEKFRVLELVEYSRVLYLDADILPECNLDYIFELSEPEGQVEPLLKENMIVANIEEASNGGFFMLRPSMEDWALMQRVIRRREEAALELPWPHWDPIEGEKLTRIFVVHCTHGSHLLYWYLNKRLGSCHHTSRLLASSQWLQAHSVGLAWRVHRPRIVVLLDKICQEERVDYHWEGSGAVGK